MALSTDKTSSGKGTTNFKKNNGKHSKKKAPHVKKQNASKAVNSDKTFRQRGRVKEIVFDPEARKEYLTGFSARKQQRRAFGLAMQKVKDRKAKLEQRKDLREAALERVEEAERLKKQVEQAALEARGLLRIKKKNDEVDSDSDDEDNNTKKQAKKDKNKESKGIADTDDTKVAAVGSASVAVVATASDANTTTCFYLDEATQQQWGGDVVVTTSSALPDSDDEYERKQREDFRKRKTHNQKIKARDTQQEFAGNVDKYLLKLKGNMPGKKKHSSTQANKHRGQHGAADMKGIGSGKVVKIAQKALAMSASAGKKGGKGGGKRKRK